MHFMSIIHLDLDHKDRENVRGQMSIYQSLLQTSLLAGLDLC